MWGSTGLTRLFSTDIGGQIAWLLPAALLFLGAGLWFTRRAPRTDRSRALLIVWGGWLLVTGLTFSEMKGIFHQYYTVALAPAVAALVGVGAASLWRGRRHLPAALTLAATVAVTAIWSFVLLDRSASWHPWLRYAVLLGGLVAAAGIAGIAGCSPAAGGRRRRARRGGQPGRARGVLDPDRLGRAQRLDRDGRSGGGRIDRRPGRDGRGRRRPPRWRRRRRRSARTGDRWHRYGGRYDGRTTGATGGTGAGTAAARTAEPAACSTAAPPARR